MTPNPQFSLEKKLLVGSSAVFVVLHAVALFVFPIFLPVPPEQDLTIDIDILPEEDFVANETELEEKLPVNMLPQLPKKFAVKTEQPPPVPEPIAEKPAPQRKPMPQPVEKHLPKKVVNEENQLKAKEALKRLALDKLRISKEQETKRLAKIQSKMQKAFASVSNIASANSLKTKYQLALRLAIKRNFILPDIYDLKNANIKVELEIKIDDKGNLMKIKVIKSSRHKIFDDLAAAAVKNSAPFPIPPRELVGKKIIIILTPMMTS